MEKEKRRKREKKKQKDIKKVQREEKGVTGKRERERVFVWGEQWDIEKWVRR